MSSPRPPSARQAPKLNKGSPLPRPRTPSLLSRHDDLTCSVFLDDDDDDDDDQEERRRRRRPPPPTIVASTTIDDHRRHRRYQRRRPSLTSSRSHPTLTHYATHLVSASHPRCIARLVDTKKPSLFPLHRLARLRVTRRLHHPPSGTSDRARAVGPPRAAPIARLPPVSLISQVLGLVAPHALRNLFGVVQHLLDRPAYLRVTST